MSAHTAGLTYEKAIRFARGSVTGPNDAQFKAIADEMVRADAAGENSCAWHAAATVMGNVCQCSPCVAQRKAVPHG